MVLWACRLTWSSGQTWQQSPRQHGPGQRRPRSYSKKTLYRPQPKLKCYVNLEGRQSFLRLDRRRLESRIGPPRECSGA